MKSERRELRFSSVASAGISLLIAIYTTRRFAVVIGAWSTIATQTKVLWSSCFITGLLLITSSILYTATDKKWLGVLHGILMAVSACGICLVSVHGLADLRAHPRGGFVEMAAVPVYGGMLILGIFAAGTALDILSRIAGNRATP